MLHEQIWYPQGIKQIMGPVAFHSRGSCTGLGMQNVRMPWLQVNSNTALALAASLVNVMHSNIEITSKGTIPFKVPFVP
jgi:hypothetical protein